MFFAFVVASAIFFSDRQILVPILSGGLVIIAAGLLDDVYRISPWQKLILQGAAAVVAVVFGGGNTPVGVSVLWIILLANAFNLIDGLDGLCSRVAVFSSFGLLALGGESPLWTLAGAVMGFLPFNLRPARSFLGDTGSLFLGFSLGVFSLPLVSVRGSGAFLPVLIVFALPLTDTAFAVLRRLAKGRSPFSSDRGHFHHRLVDRGFTHGEASLLLSLVSLALSSVGVALGG